jgi:hypothetical protein
MLFVFRRSVALVSAHSSASLCAGPLATTRLRHRAEMAAAVFAVAVAHARYGHTLCFYIRPHCPQCPAVTALKLHLVPVTAGAPYRVKATGIMQSGLRWWRSPSRRRSPVAYAPYAPPTVRPWGGCSAVALVSCFASVPVSGLRPVITCVPLPTHRGLAAARHWPPGAGLPVCPPRGRPQSGAGVGGQWVHAGASHLPLRRPCFSNIQRCG